MFSRSFLVAALLAIVSLLPITSVARDVSYSLESTSEVGKQAYILRQYVNARVGLEALTPLAEPAFTPQARIGNAFDTFALHAVRLLVGGYVFTEEEEGRMLAELEQAPRDYARNIADYPPAERDKWTLGLSLAIAYVLGDSLRLNPALDRQVSQQRSMVALKVLREAVNRDRDTSEFDSLVEMVREVLDEATEAGAETAVAVFMARYHGSYIEHPSDEEWHGSSDQHLRRGLDVLQAAFIRADDNLAQAALLLEMTDLRKAMVDRLMPASGRNLDIAVQSLTHTMARRQCALEAFARAAPSQIDGPETFQRAKESVVGAFFRELYLLAQEVGDAARAIKVGEEFDQLLQGNLRLEGASLCNPYNPHQGLPVGPLSLVTDDMEPEALANVAEVFYFLARAHWDRLLVEEVGSSHAASIDRWTERFLATCDEVSSRAKAGSLSVQRVEALTLEANNLATLQENLGRDVRAHEIRVLFDRTIAPMLLAAQTDNAMKH